MKFNLIKNWLSNWLYVSSKQREKFVFNWLSTLEKNKSLLDAGAGEQKYKKYAKHLNYISQDFGKFEGMDFIENNIKREKWDSKECEIISDITNIPLKDNSIDHILCTEVFEHIPDPIAALKELSRILKTEGSIALTVPYRCLYHQEPYFFYSGFSTYWFEYHANELGLKINFIEPNGNYFKEIANEITRIWRLPKNPLFRLLVKVICIKLLFILYILDKSGKSIPPKNCWGYHLILEKL